MREGGMIEAVNGRLRIQGVEVPFYGATSQFGINVPTQGTVFMQPVREAKRIRPNTMVHVFSRNPHRSLICGQHVNELFFEGEVVGRSYGYASGRRSVALHCVDFANYFVHARQYYLNFSAGNILGAADQAIMSGVTKLSGSLLSSKEGIVNAFNKMKGDRFDAVLLEIVREVAAINPFFARHYERLKIPERFFSSSTKKMTQALFSHDLFNKFIKHELQKKGGTQPIWTMLSMLLNIVHHEMVSIPSPSFVPTPGLLAIDEDITSVSSSTRIKAEKEKEALQVQLGGDLWNDKTIRRYTLETPFKEEDRKPVSIVVKPSAFMLEPPACNVFFPNEFSEVSFSENFQTKPTRMQFVPFHPIMDKTQLQALLTIYQPESLHQFVRNNYGETKLIGGLGDLLKKKNAFQRDFHYLTDEELERGIVLSQASILPGATSMLSSLQKPGATKSGSSSSNLFLHRLAEYEFLRQRAASNQVQVRVSYKPYVLAGYNALFLDKSDLGFDILAMVSAGSHSIDPNGNVSTTLQLSMPRELSDETVYFLDAKDLGNLSSVADTTSFVPTRDSAMMPSEAPLPDWFDDSYQPGRIGKEVYGHTLGCLGFLNIANKTAANVPMTTSRPLVVRDEGQAKRTHQETERLHRLEVQKMFVEGAKKLKDEFAAHQQQGTHDMYVYKSTFRPVITEPYTLANRKNK